MFVLSCKGTKPSAFSRAGERDSLYIYVFHPFLLMFLASVVKRQPNTIGLCYDYTAPLVVLILTMAFTVTLRKIKQIK